MTGQLEQEESEKALEQVTLPGLPGPPGNDVGNKQINICLGCKSSGWQTRVTAGPLLSPSVHLNNDFSSYVFLLLVFCTLLIYFFKKQGVVNYNEIKNFIQQQVVKVFNGEDILFSENKDLFFLI